MMGRLHLPERGRSGPWIVALGIALVLAIQPIWRDSVAVAVTAAIALTLVAAARWQLRWLPVAVLVLCGIALRLAVMHQQASDVSDVTEYAIRTMLDGGNPYGMGYNVSNPPGAAFPYGPVVLLWYLPSFGDPSTLELLVSIAVLLYFGFRAGNGRPLGLAIFAVTPPLVLAAIDGSNDTSAGLLILAALAVAATRPIVGAGILAIAVAFKPYAVAWLLPLIAWGGLSTLVAFTAVSLIAWSPVLLMWGPGSYLRSLSMAQETHLRQSYWSLAAILDGIAPGLAPRALETIRYFVSGAIAIVGALRVRSIDGVIVVGTLAFVAAQFGGYFGSYVYIAAIAPVLCWRVDDWLRMGLPELLRAYGEVPHVGRRFRRPAVQASPAPTHGSGLPGIAPRAGQPARLVHSVQTPRGRASRPSRNPSG